MATRIYKVNTPTGPVLVEASSVGQAIGLAIAEKVTATVCQGSELVAMLEAGNKVIRGPAKAAAAPIDTQAVAGTAALAKDVPPIAGTTGTPQTPPSPMVQTQHNIRPSSHEGHVVGTPEENAVDNTAAFRAEPGSFAANNAGGVAAQGAGFPGGFQPAPIFPPAGAKVAG